MVSEYIVIQILQLDGPFVIACCLQFIVVQAYIFTICPSRFSKPVLCVLLRSAQFWSLLGYLCVFVVAELSLCKTLQDYLEVVAYRGWLFIYIFIDCVHTARWLKLVLTGLSFIPVCIALIISSVDPRGKLLFSFGGDSDDDIFERDLPFNPVAS